MATYHMNANERITDVPGTLVFECYDRRMREGAQHFGVHLPEWQGNRYKERYNALYNDLAALAVRLDHTSEFRRTDVVESLKSLLEQHK
jgi:hypothetical protein